VPAPLGWHDRQAALAADLPPGLTVGRVARVDRGRATVLTSSEPLRPLTPTPVAVGDWVAVDESADRIHTVLPRHGTITRRDPDGRSAALVVAANVDRVLVVHALNQPVNRSRLERELVVAWESGTRPAVVLTKIDLATWPDDEIEAAASVALGVDLVPVNGLTGAGFDDLQAILEPGTTFVVLGASGVGKSTLVNRLVGQDLQGTQSIREADGRGRHTTTAGQLVVLPGGAILIDTPGLKALALWDGDDGLQHAFADIERLAAACRFADCEHRSEPGCAVVGAVDARRLASWRKLKRELARTAGERSVWARNEERRRWKAITKANRAHRPRP
jgi:ribosome biogenesis GTPase